MSNFQFLLPEFPRLHEPARGAEQLAYSDPRACCMRTRHALEQTVHWLYENDQDLRMPYDRSLNVLLTQVEFTRFVPENIQNKARLIQKLGNQAVHSNAAVSRNDALQLVRELFHILFWVARTYTRASDPKSIAAVWNDANIPSLVAAADAVKYTRDELKKQEAKFQEQIAAQHATLEKREAAIAEQAVTLGEREALLASVNSELAALRAELARAKAASIAVPDTHDYNEADTRRLLIDTDLRAAGWELGQNASIEVPVFHMPEGKGEGFADYVLWGEDGKPLAVVEAKRTLRDAEVGKQQAKLYADCLETERGQRPLIFYTNGHHTWLWDDRRAPPREVQGFYTRDELASAIARRGLQVNLRSLAVNKDIAGRPYQNRAIRAMAESFTQGHRAGLLTMATGTGKTRTAVALVELLMRANIVKRVLFLADRIALVKQATKAFKEHLPLASPLNLCEDIKDRETTLKTARVLVSTYPTMMGLIDEMKGEERAFGIGHFDLVIIDEAHRSVYQKYGAIFKYFDSYLVGLTATPRDEVDRDTYHLFGLETGVPTDSYSLDEAVADGFLVPPVAHSVPIRFVREGIRYDDLSADEREHWESLDWGDRAGEGEETGIPDEVLASEVNKQLFNESTVDLMLQHLMVNGLKVEGGDKLGRTIIFAVNQKHADFIGQRFDHHYPHYKGEFARVITHSVSYAQSLIESFGSKNAGKLPQIAISVDMLDTGIDVPQVLNLVFFKAVRSKVKFLQMIGRGTRLCPDIFAPGVDKTDFATFDFCANFEFFGEHPNGATGSTSEPLARRLFKARIDLLSILTEPEGLTVGAGGVANNAKTAYDAHNGLKRDLADELHGEVAAMNRDNFIVRPQEEYVSPFRGRDAWDSMDQSALGDLRHYVAGLPSQREAEHISAKLFDLACVNLQLALVRSTGDFIGYRDRVIAVAEQLDKMDSIPAIRAELAYIQSVQTEEFWQDITLSMIEQTRRKLRGLVKFIERRPSNPVYSVLTDEIGESTVVTLADFSTGINEAQYRKKVEAYIRANENHLAVAKLRHNRALTPADLASLEQLVYRSDVVESRERFEKTFGTEQSLPLFIRSLVGMDRAAAKAAFAAFLDEARYSSRQIRFVDMIIDRLTAHGVVEPGALYEPPFTAVHDEGLDGVFGDGDAEGIVAVVRDLNSKAA
jgi:type I restriction enzyme R subunit